MLKGVFLYKQHHFFDELAYLLDELAPKSKKPFIYKSCQLV